MAREHVPRGKQLTITGCEHVRANLGVALNLDPWLHVEIRGKRAHATVNLSATRRMWARYSETILYNVNLSGRLGSLTHSFVAPPASKCRPSGELQWVCFSRAAHR